MVKQILFLIFVACSSMARGQVIKTDVLVVGNGTGSAPAAIQAARSKLKTILAIPGSQLGNFKTPEITVDYRSSTAASGFWAEFRNDVSAYYKGKPRYEADQDRNFKFEAAVGEFILKNITDTTKNLTVDSGSTFVKIDKDGDRWGVSFKQGEKTIEIKTRIVIDATENSDVVIAAGAKSPNLVQRQQTGAGSKYRTSIAGTVDFSDTLAKSDNNVDEFYPPAPVFYLPLAKIVSTSVDNLLVTQKIISENFSFQLPLQLNAGQGAGTVAAYCAFNKTTTKNLKVRIIQGELLDFKANLLPFSDVPVGDRDWRTVQQIGATGLLKGVLKSTEKGPRFLFLPDSTVNTDELKPILVEIYTRAFLWFNREKPGEKFTIGNTLSLISDYTLADPPLLKSIIQKDWKAQYKFTVDFDLNRAVTRREFSVLINKYLNPFGRTVDLNGRLVN